MKPSQEKQTGLGTWLALGIPAFLLVVCCALPVLLIGIGLTAAGAFLIGMKDWIIGIVVVAAGLFFLVRTILRKKSDSEKSCCMTSTPDQKG
ncbi:hypothetical protein JZ785_03925 [Alicyclobacillus curvatus]|nr:hypothetical protein JZ785_03925 [Alicyclobacillus curvatus]